MESHITSKPNSMANGYFNTLKPKAPPKRVTVVQLKLCDNCTAIKNKDDPSKYRAYSVEDLMEEFSNHIATFDHNSHNATNRHRHLVSFPNLYLTGPQLQTLQEVSTTVLAQSYNGPEGEFKGEFSLDLLASTVVGLLCEVPFWAYSAQTFGASVAVAQLICGWVGFFAGEIFAMFTWFGDPTLDNAYWTVQTANANYADGSTLNIAYHRGGDRDNDNLGYINRGSSVTTVEDLDSRPVEYIEGKLLQYNTAMSTFVLPLIVKFDQLFCLVYIAGSTDDVCVTEMVSGFISVTAQLISFRFT